MGSSKGTRTDDDVALDIAVGVRIRQFRDQAGLNQTELGRAAGVTFQQVQKYEKGHNRVAASRLAAIAKALGIPAAQLLGEDGVGTSVTKAGQELEILTTNYRRCSKAGQAAIRALAVSLASQA